MLPFAVRREGKALGLHPLGVQLDQLFGDVFHSLADLCLLPLPVGAAQAAELNGGILPGADILAHQVQLGNWHILGVVFGVAHLDVVLVTPFISSLWMPSNWPIPWVAWTT